MRSPGSLLFSARRGFSLIELLAVMAVLAFLAAASVPAISGLTRGNVMNKNLLVFAGVLEQARQQAISKNTYVWVVLSDPATAGDPIKVGQIASRDGTDALAWSSSPLTLSATTNLEMVGKPRDLTWVRVENSSRPDAGVAMANVNIADGAQGRTYTLAIQFTPTGEARVGASVARFIDVAILQDTGNTANQGVLRIAGLTGKTSVQRDRPVGTWLVHAFFGGKARTSLAPQSSRARTVATGTRRGRRRVWTTRGWRGEHRPDA